MKLTNTETSEMEYSEQFNGFPNDIFTAIFVDLPGYGRSLPYDKVLKNWHKTDASLLAELLKNLKITKVSIVGFKDGGRIAIWMASLYPDLVDHLVICSCNGYFSNNDKQKMWVIR